MTNRWYCMVFQMTTGAVVNELPLFKDPTWTQQINQQGSYTVQTPIGLVQGPNGPVSGLDKMTLRGLLEPGRFGLAICYGDGSPSDYIAQAGPLWKPPLVTENPPVVEVQGTGLWGMLSARVQVPSGWVTSAGLGDPTSVAAYGPTSLQGVAVAIINNAVARGSLPVDVPAAIAGTLTRTYFGYDLAYAGQRLQELTQEDVGPDILFQPYFSTPTLIRWQALIGNPRIAQSGLPLAWDYGSNLSSLLPSPDGIKLSTTNYVKGNGVEAAVLWAFARDTTLTANGWPLLEYVDSSHSGEINQGVLQGYANANQKLYGRPVETWAVVVRSDMAPALGTYTPGTNATYNITNHPWEPDGQYSQRIIGLTNGSQIGEVVHILQAIQGVL